MNRIYMSQKYMFRNILILMGLAQGVLTSMVATGRGIFLVGAPSIKVLALFIVQILNCYEKHFAGSFLRAIMIYDIQEDAEKGGINIWEKKGRPFI